MGLGRARGWLAAAAALLVVGLMAVLLFSLGPSRPGSRSTAAATATAGRISGHWQTVPHLSHELTAPIVAPSDPQVAYELEALSDNGVAHGMRRTDDGGASWHALPDPTIPGPLLGAAIRVSPVDARNVFLQLEFGVQMTGDGVPTLNCPGPLASVAPSTQGNLLLSPLSNYGGCPALFYSTDGGDHWAPSKLPAPSQLVYTNFSWPIGDLGVVQAQGTRLYAAMQPVPVGTSPVGVRLMVSIDRGATWNFADVELVSQAPIECDATAAPQGATLFALTAESDCFAMDQPARWIWRSDDGGDHWTKIGAAPGYQARFAGVALGANAAQPIPYLLVAANSVDSLLKLAASQDGGRTWQLAPTAGVPSTMQFFEVAGVASNDSLIVAMQPAVPTAPTTSSGATPTPALPRTSYTLTLFSWKAGDAAWRQISGASRSIGQPGYALVAPGGGTTPASIWIVSLHGDIFSPGSTYDLDEYVLG